MRNVIIVLALITAICMGSVSLVCAYNLMANGSSNSVLMGPPAILAPTPSKPDLATEQAKFSQFVSQVMDVCGNIKISDARRQILADQIAIVLVRPELPRAYAESFVSLICIESRFDPAAKSTVGAVGLSQIMPKFATEFAKACGYGAVTETDLWDTETNLRIGSCHFAALLDHFEGNVALAAAAYNSGQASATTKAMAALSTGHPETAGYVAKFYMLSEKVRIVNGLDAGLLSGESDHGQVQGIAH